MKKNILFTIDMIIPGLIFYFGWLVLSVEHILTWNHALTFIVLPLVMTAISVVFHFAVKSKIVKLLMIIFVYLPVGFIAFVALILYNFIALGTYHDDELEVKYSDAQYESHFLPTLSEVGDTEDMTYYLYEEICLIFAWDADVLVCEYSEAEYIEQKAKIEEKYVFEDEVDVSYNDYDPYVCYPYAEIDGFLFRRLENSAEDGGEYYYYPKYVYLIGTNDETREIVYIDFYDIDLDYISSLDEFIEGDCGWKYISRARGYR